MNLIFDILCFVGFDVVRKEIWRAMFINVVLAVKFVGTFLFDAGSVLGFNGSELWSSDLFTWLWSHGEVLFRHGLRNSAQI